MSMGKCPKCGHYINAVDISPIDVYSKGAKTWNGAAYSCQSCFAILSVGVDPIALKADTVQEIVQELKRQFGR